MSRTLVLMAPVRDRLAARIARQLGARATWLREPLLRASFRVEGEPVGTRGHFLVGPRTLDWDGVAALVVRPHAAWLPSRRFATVEAGFSAHENRAAVCALTAAFPGPVANRLPPAWFIDRALTAQALARDLARRAQLPAVARDGRQGARRVRVWWCGGRHLLARRDGTASAAFAEWVDGWSAALPDWCRTHGLHLLRIEGEAVGSGWALQALDPAPPLASLDEPELATLAASLIEALA